MTLVEYLYLPIKLTMSKIKILALKSAYRKRGEYLLHSIPNYVQIQEAKIPSNKLILTEKVQNPDREILIKDI